MSLFTTSIWSYSLKSASADLELLIKIMVYVPPYFSAIFNGEAQLLCLPDFSLKKSELPKRDKNCFLNLKDRILIEIGEANYCRYESSGSGHSPEYIQSSTVILDSYISEYYFVSKTINLKNLFDLTSSSFLRNY